MSDVAISDEDLDKLISTNNYQDIEERHGLVPNTLTAIQVVGERSGSNDTSPKGAKGQFQIMPNVAKAYGVSDTSNNRQSAEGAAKLLKDVGESYRKMYPKASDEQIRLATIAHYNGGWGAGKAVLEGREPPAKETRDYLKRVTGSTLYSREETPISDSELDSLIKNSNERAISDSELDTLIGSPSQNILQKQVSQDQLSPRAREYTHQYSASQGYKQPDAPTFYQGKHSEDLDKLSKLNETLSPVSKPIAIGLQQGIKTVSAGAIQPKWFSHEEVDANPIASTVGGVLGVAPYTFIPGGLPVQAASLAGRAATESALSGGSGEDMAIKAGVESIPYIGSTLIGKGVSKIGSKILAKVLEKTLSEPEKVLVAQGTKLYNESVQAAKSGVPEAVSAVKANFESEVMKNVTSAFIKDAEAGLLSRQELLAKYPELVTEIRSSWFQTGRPFSENLKTSIDNIQDYFRSKIYNPSASSNVGGSVSETLKGGVKDFSKKVDIPTVGRAIVGDPYAAAQLKQQGLSSLLGQSSKLLPETRATMGVALGGVGHVEDYAQYLVKKEIESFTNGSGSKVIEKLIKDNPFIRNTKYSPEQQTALIKDLLLDQMRTKGEKIGEASNLLGKVAQMGWGSGVPIAYSTLEQQRVDKLKGR
jgi:hypothetical protein